MSPCMYLFSIGLSPWEEAGESKCECSLNKEEGGMEGWEREDRKEGCGRGEQNKLGNSLLPLSLLLARRTRFPWFLRLRERKT